MSERDKLRPYKATYNIQMYNCIDRVDLTIRETHPSREIIDIYSENNYYGGISFVFDNLSRMIWVWIAKYSKKRSWAKKLTKENDADKFTKKTYNVLEDLLQRKLDNFEVRRVDEGNHPDDFEMMFLYEVQDIDLYSEHYLRGDVTMLMPDESSYYVEEKVEKCPKCGWILSADKTKCPMCKFDHAAPVEDPNPPDENSENSENLAPNDKK